MVEDVDAQELTGLHHLAGHVHVVAAGRGVAGGVVVHDDEGRTALADSLAEELAYPHQGGVDVALVDLGHGQHLVLGVQEEDSQVLLIEEAHLGHDEVSHILGRLHRRSLLGLGGEQAAAQLKGGLHLGRLGLAQAALAAELAETGPGQAGQAAEAGQGATGQSEDVLGVSASAQDDGQELGTAKGGGTPLAQSLAGALGGGQVANGRAIFRGLGRAHGLDRSHGTSP